MELVETITKGHEWSKCRELIMRCPALIDSLQHNPTPKSWGHVEEEGRKIARTREPGSQLRGYVS